jgi:hypothetical protein
MGWATFWAIYSQTYPVALFDKQVIKCHMTNEVLPKRREMSKKDPCLTWPDDGRATFRVRTWLVVKILVTLSKKSSQLRGDWRQGCQIFLGTTDQNGKMNQNDHEIYQMAIQLTSGSKIDEISIKYTNIFH